MKTLYPKILIISEYFTAGDSVTALNLFSKWNNENLFCITRTPSNSLSNFKSSYVLGSNEVKFKFPFSLFFKTHCGGIYKQYNKQSIVKKSNVVLDCLKSVILYLMKLTGVISNFYKINLSNDLKNWIEEESPDYIYSAVNTIPTGYFIKELLNSYPSIKLIYHGYDDWTEPTHKEIFNFNKNKSKELLAQVLNCSTLRFCTSIKMAEDYKKIYKLNFDVLLNPVEIQDIKISKNINDTIFFAGKLWEHNIEALERIIQAVDELNKTGKNINIDIYTDANDKIIKSLKKKYMFVNIHGWVSHDMILQIISKSKLLLLPITIDKYVEKFTRYSMSTKIAEYLASSVPVLYMGPKGISMTEFFENNKCSFMINNNNSSTIREVVYNALYNDMERNNVIMKAKSIYHTYFEKEKVCQDFYSKILNHYNA